MVSLLALPCGCAELGGDRPDLGGERPRKLAARIARADSIVVTSYLAEVDQRHRDMRFVITGPTVGNEVLSASAAGRNTGGLNLLPESLLEFYKGTNDLDGFAFVGDVLAYEEEQYGDGSTVLKDLDEELKGRLEIEK